MRAAAIEDTILDEALNYYVDVGLYAKMSRERLPMTKTPGLLTRVLLKTRAELDRAFWAKRSVALLCSIGE